MGNEQYEGYEIEKVQEESPERGKLYVRIAALVIVAVLSVVVSGMFSSPDTYDGTIGKLDNKKQTVAKMAAGVTAASAAITLVPGDAGTPIAEELADLGGYFVFIYSAIYIEKYLTTTSGLISFRFLIPIALLLMLLGLLRNENAAGRMRSIGRKLLLFSLILWAVVPVSVMISGNIEKTYEDSINESLAKVEAVNEKAEKTEDGDTNLVGGLFGDNEKDTEGIGKKFQDFLNNMLDAIAVMIVTACVIPICVLLFMLWVVKMLFGINLQLPSPKGKGKALHRKARAGIGGTDSFWE